MNAPYGPPLAYRKVCAACLVELPAVAESCTRCGAPQFPPVAPSEGAPPRGTLWLPVPAFVIALFVMLLALALAYDVDFDPRARDDWQTLGGLLTFWGGGLGLGIASVATQARGQGLAIAGLVISVLSALVLLGWMTA
jgi:hypothetical protein